MDILVEFTAAGSETKRLQINNAPEGTALVVLEQFLAGAGATRQMVEEATDGHQEPAPDVFPDPIELNYKNGDKTLFAVRETIALKQAEAARSRLPYSRPGLYTRSDARRERELERQQAELKAAEIIRDHEKPGR